MWDVYFDTMVHINLQNSPDNLAALTQAYERKVLRVFLSAPNVEEMSRHSWSDGAGCLRVFETALGYCFPRIVDKAFAIVRREIASKKPAKGLGHLSNIPLTNVVNQLREYVSRNDPRWREVLRQDFIRREQFAAGERRLAEEARKLPALRGSQSVAQTVHEVRDRLIVDRARGFLGGDQAGRRLSRRVLRTLPSVNALATHAAASVVVGRSRNWLPGKGDSADSEHLVYASYADHFVTDDKRLTELFGYLGAKAALHRSEGFFCMLRSRMGK